MPKSSEKAGSPGLDSPLFCIAQPWSAIPHNLTGARAEGDQITEYGAARSNGAALIGILYDLKQNQARQKLKMGPVEHDALVNEFLSSNWDEAALNRYYQIPLPL